MSTLLNNFREKTQRAGLVRLPQIPPPSNLSASRRATSPSVTFSRRRARTGLAHLAPPTRRLASSLCTWRRWHLRPSPTDDELPVPHPLACAGCRQVGSYLDAHHLDAPPRHLQCHRRHHDHSHRRARHQARILYPVHPGSRRGGTFDPEARFDRTLPAILFRAPNATYPLSAIHARARESRGGPLTSPHHIEQQEMPDIDSVDRENPLAVTEYVNDIFSYWFRVEVRVRYCPLFSVIHLRGWPTSASKGQLSLRSFESICPGARSSRQSCAWITAGGRSSTSGQSERSDRRYSAHPSRVRVDAPPRV